MKYTLHGTTKHNGERRWAVSDSDGRILAFIKKLENGDYEAHTYGLPTVYTEEFLTLKEAKVWVMRKHGVL